MNPAAQQTGAGSAGLFTRALAESIDWQQPWLSPWRDFAPALLSASRPDRPVAAALNDLQAVRPPAASEPQPMRFVSQSALPEGEAYEAFIFKNRQVPTRDNLHDLFNGLCWLQFPHTKRRLNALQAEQIAAAGVQPLRGPVRDALTVFDENAAFLMAPAPLWEALVARQWQRLFIDLRPLWAEARLVLFGHALLEKLVHPRKAITAHVFGGPAPGATLADLDAWAASQLSAAHLATKPFVPLQVLGVPAWWPANAEPGFYDDPGVFRPAPAGQ
jgi:hypothetical protein